MVFTASVVEESASAADDTASAVCVSKFSAASAPVKTTVSVPATWGGGASIKLPVHNPIKSLLILSLSSFCYILMYGYF